MGWSWAQQPQPTLKECLFIGERGSRCGGERGPWLRAQGPPVSPSHSTDMQIFIYKRGSWGRGCTGGSAQTPSSRGTNKKIQPGQRVKENRRHHPLPSPLRTPGPAARAPGAPGRQKAEIGGGLGTGAVSSVAAGSQVRSHLCGFQVLVVRFGWEPHGLENKTRE